MDYHQRRQIAAILGMATAHIVINGNNEANDVDPETTDQQAECADCPNVTTEPFDCRQCGRLFCGECAPKRLTWCQECQADICDKHDHEHDAWGA